MSLACERFEGLLGDFSEGRISAEDRHAMESHRLACESCARLLADYQRVPAFVRRATDVTMPIAAQARLRRLLSRAWRSRS